MQINVKKLNGTTEPLNINKILRWGSWAAAESKDISFESILTSTSTAFYDGVSTSEITEAICKACEDLAEASASEEAYHLVEQYNNLARNLYIPNILKKANYFQSLYLTEEDYAVGSEFRISDTDVVPLQRYKLKSILELGIKLGTYDPDLLDGSLTDELFEYAEEILDYKRMHLHPYGGLRQAEEKYLRRVDGNCLEDPQQLAILMALAGLHSDIKTYPNGHDIEFQKDTLVNYYTIISKGEMNSPTPFLLSLRTDFKQYDSCTLYSIGDENVSIKAGMSVAMEATVAGAGVGVSLGRIRSKGTRFRKMGKHQGALGYLGQLTKTVKASNQECYPRNTRVLTSTGFKPIEDITTDHKVAQVDDKGSITFVNPTRVFEYPNTEKLIHFKGNGVSQPVTQNHNMIYKKVDEDGTLKSKFKERPASELKLNAKKAFIKAGLVEGLTDVSDDEILLNILDLFFRSNVQSSYDTTTYFDVPEEHDEIFKHIIDQSSLKYLRVVYQFKVSYTVMSSKHLSGLEFLLKVDHTRLLKFKDILKELSHNQLCYTLLDVEDVQAIFAVMGIGTTIEKVNGFSRFFVLDTDYVVANLVDKEEVDYNDTVYCLEVPTHRLVVVYEDDVLVCGNSRGGGATVNFPLWTRDIYDLLMLKDVTGVEGENRYRHLDYAFHFAMYHVEKLRNNEKILLASPNTLVAPGITIYDAFYNVDGNGNYDPELYNKFCEDTLKNPDIPYINNENASTASAGGFAYTLAYDLFGALVQQMLNTGRIYTFNVDNVNNHSAFLDAVEMSNLCLGAGTPVLTREGYKPIETLEDKEVEVWNGKQWSKTEFKKTSDNSKLLKVSFSDGSSIFATEYHKWFLADSSMKRTVELVANDKLLESGDPDDHQIKHGIFVLAVEDLGVTGPTWCCTEPLENKFIANGILTGNCMEILQPTSPVSLTYNSKEHMFIPGDTSEVSFCQLAGIVVGRDVTLEDLPRICYWTLRLQEAIFNISDYSSISFSHKQKKRRNVGIGLVNLQHLLVREVYSKFPQKDWVREVGRVTHEWYEAIQYNLILASTQIAEVLGPCEMIDRSRYGHGILPIDHYRPSPLTDFELKQDWEGTLRPRLIKFKSRFGVISALMPAESSSVYFGTINSIEPPRKPCVFKGNKKLSVLVTVPEVAKYGKHYVYAWGNYSVDINKIYLSTAANITKFLDQSISYNTYFDYNRFPDNKIPESYAIKTLIIEPSYAGVKTTYYANFNIDIVDKEAQTSSEELSEEEKQFYENLRQLEQDNAGGCTSGACSL